jgi:hypothetical protein
MELILPPGVQQNLRFAANHARHKTYLLDLDRKRFRGLGEAHTLSFIRHATSYTDWLGLRYTEEIQYVMFVMYFLGSFFYEDPRYATIAAPLTQPGESGEQRVMACHTAFADFATTYLGEDLGLYRKALLRFAVEAEGFDRWRSPVADSFAAFFRAFALPDTVVARFPIAQMTENATGAAVYLGLQGETGVATCLLLSFWIGSGFHADPLFPWVRDKVLAAGSSPLAREQALRSYGMRRLIRQTKTLAKGA